MPKSQHIHKSMLLRGVKFPPSVLNSSDIEQIKGRAARSGRAYGGVPLEGDFRGHNNLNLAPAGQNSQHSQGLQNGYSRRPDYPPPPYAGWQPPPPGSDGFALGTPPPYAGWQPPPPGSGGFARGPPPPPLRTYESDGQGPTPPPSYPHLSNGYGSRSERGSPGYSRPDDWHRGDEQRRRGSNSYKGGELYRGGNLPKGNDLYYRRR